MKELKKEFRWFNIMEYEKEENYLSKRHQEGWKFKRVIWKENTRKSSHETERAEPISRTFKAGCSFLQYE